MVDDLGVTSGPLVVCVHICMFNVLLSLSGSHCTCHFLSYFEGASSHASDWPQLCFPPVSRSLIILVYFSPSFHSARCRDLLHFPAVCSACLISSGVVPVYLVLYFTAVSSKIKACLWVCSGILSCLLHTAIHDPDINKYTDSPSAPFHWSELARCFQKEIQTYVNRLLTTLLTPSLSVLDLSC